MNNTTLKSLSTTEYWMLQNVNPTSQSANGTNVTENERSISLGTIFQCAVLFSVVILTIIGNTIVLLAFIVEKRLTKVS